ncbi:MAG TPA: putative porin [Parafilimonas sp.]|nr:putative porin [Parafilimonas sp.]
MLKQFCFVFLLMMCGIIARTQVYDTIPGGNYEYDSRGRPIKVDSSNQTLQHRDVYEDSITIFYRYWDSTHINKIDSSINDFYTRYPVPWWYVDFGNFGSAAHSLIFQPNMRPGFDAGFHAYDIYRYTPENTKFYQTTRPYSETSYLLGSRGEQMVNLFHTQNRKSNFNIAFDFRVINSPGAFKNLNTNNSNLRVNTFYQSTNKRYINYFAVITNKILSSENGGLKPNQDLDSLSFHDPYGALTKLGSELPPYSRNIFGQNLTIGTQYKEAIFLMRQSYDFGQKDSLVTDSTTYKLFYPRLRIQHTIQFTNDNYEYHDYAPVDSDYIKYLDYTPAITHNGTYAADTIKFADKWQILTNDVALISYPQKNNLNQFLKLNAGYELIKGNLGAYRETYNNIYTGAEYRNRTRNQLYDVEAVGKLYVAGHYAGDYSAYISLRRSLRKNIGSLQVGFQNVNRTPSFLEDGSVGTHLVDSASGAQIDTKAALTNFPVTQIGNFNKENITRVFAVINIPPADFQLTGEYYLVTNYTYFSSLYTATQSSSLFNVLHIAAQKKISVSKHFNWYLEGNLQQTTGNPPVNLPLVLARSRFAFEGNFYKNLFLSTGIEIRYYTPYKAPGYSPLNGQFFFQDTTTITPRPDVNLFFNFRIKSFKAFIRLENLNTIDPANGFSFTKYNYVAPLYPARALWFRIGIWWNFVN